MQVLVRSKSFTVTQALQAFVAEHAQRLNKVGHRLLRVETYLEKTRAQTRALVKVIQPGRDIVVQEVAGDVYQAISQALDKAHRAIRKDHERKISQHRLRAFRD